MTEWVIYKNSRCPAHVSYSGPTWERANLRGLYQDVYHDFFKASSIDYHLTLANPGVGFSVAERPAKS